MKIFSFSLCPPVFGLVEFVRCVVLYIVGLELPDRERNTAAFEPSESSSKRRVCEAIGVGAMTVSHANDSYFWVVTNFGGMIGVFILSLFIR